MCWTNGKLSELPVTVPHTAEGKLSELLVTVMWAACKYPSSTFGMQHGGHVRGPDAEQLLVREKEWADWQWKFGETHG